MGMHYIAQHYLKGFLGENGGIWCFDRESSTPFASVPKSLANERKLWPQEVEDFITQDVEGPANPVLTKIRARERLSLDDRRALARYLIMQKKRVPAARQAVYSHVPRMVDELRPEMHAELDAMAQKRPDLRDRIEARRTEADEAFDKFKRDPADPAIWCRGLDIDRERTDRLVETLLSLKWNFLVAASGDQFLTSDNPVYFHERLGLGHPDAEFSIPLAQDVALLAARKAIPGWVADGEYTTVRSKLVHEMNRRTAHNRHRFVFAARNEAWIQPFLAKPSWKLRSIRP